MYMYLHCRFLSLLHLSSTYMYIANMPQLLSSAARSLFLSLPLSLSLSLPLSLVLYVRRTPVLSNCLPRSRSLSHRCSFCFHTTRRPIEREFSSSVLTSPCLRFCTSINAVMIHFCPSVNPAASAHAACTSDISLSSVCKSLSCVQYGNTRTGTDGPSCLRR